MFTGFLWLALSIGSEITGTSMIKKTNSFSKLGPSVLVIIAYCLCYFALTVQWVISQSVWLIHYGVGLVLSV